MESPPIVEVLKKNMFRKFRMVKKLIPIQQSVLGCLAHIWRVWKPILLGFPSNP